MRAPSFCRGAALLAAILFVAPTAHAGPDDKATGGKTTQAKKKGRKKVDPDVVDVSAYKAELVVYTDGDGGFFAAVPGNTDALFYGDGKVMYQQRAFSSFRDGGKGTWSMRMWSPRVNNVADIDGKGGDKGTLTCGKDTFELTRLPDVEAAKLVDQAAFRRHPWKRQAHALSRDDRGTYYYVDRLRDEHGGKGFRLFAGVKGAMKELPLTNIVSDSQGEIFASKRGELRFVQAPNQAIWIKGEKRTELVTVPIEMNLELVYRELGVYEGSLGTPCDEY